MSIETFGRYQLLRKLATGGMAEIYLARQVGPEGFEKTLVVKRILPHLSENREFITMFLDEARIAARLNHPNIVQIFDLGAHDGTYFIAMEYIHGEDARRVWKQAERFNTNLPIALTCRIIIEACAGLDYAHKKCDPSGRPLNIVHRDVSPQNILVSFEGGVKVVDFGIAKAADQGTVTRSGVLKGKYSYMSPEQASGEPIDHRSDIFALGVVMYELLTGTRLFKRPNDRQTLQAVADCLVPPPSAANPSIPRDLDELVLRALQRERGDRYPEARTFAAELENWLLDNRLPSSSAHVAEFLQEIYSGPVDQGDGTEVDRPSRKPEPLPPPVPLERLNSDPHSDGRRSRPSSGARAAASRRPVEQTLALPSPQPTPAATRPIPRVESALEATATFLDAAPEPPVRGRWAVGLVGGLAVAAVALIAVMAFSGPASVRVTSDPPGGKVTLDGVEKCAATPCVFEAKAGQHMVTVMADGFEPLAASLTVPTRGLVEPQTYVLVPVPKTRRVTFSIVTHPSGAVASLNGIPLPTPTPVDATADEGQKVELSLELKGYLPQTDTFTAQAISRNYTLSPAPPPEDAEFGTVIFTVTPAATVECGSHDFGLSPLKPQALPAGDYVCHFKWARAERSQVVHVAPGGVARVNVRLP